MTPHDVIAAFEVLAEAPEGVTRLRELVLQLAVRGKLVPQDPDDEPASVLLERIAAERASRVKERSAPASQPLPSFSQDERPFEGPQGWRWTTLGVVAEVIRGVTYSKADASDANGDDRVALLRAHNIQSGIKLIDLVYIRRSLVRPEQFLQPNDVLFCIASGSPRLVGKSARIADRLDATFGAFTAVARPFQSLQSRFVSLFSDSPSGRDILIGFGRGIGINNLKTSDLACLPLPIPPLAEQHRIVARVDELMGLLDRMETARNARDGSRMALRDSALAALRDADTQGEAEAAWHRIAERMDDLFTDPADVDPLRQAVLQLAVRGRLVPTDPEDEPANVLLERIAAEKARLGREGKIRASKSLPPVSEDEVPFELPRGWAWARPDQVTAPDRHALAIGPFGSSLLKSDYRDSGVPLVFVREIRAEVFGDEKTKFVTPSKAEELVAHVVKPGDLLLTKMGAPPGDTAVYPSNRPPAIITADCVRFSVHPEAGGTTWLKYAYRAPVVRQMILEITMGIAHQKMSLKRFRMTPIPVPPLAEQRRIVARVDELMALLNRLEQHLIAKTTTHDAFAAAAVHHLDA
jgi:type I restriction enzyme S subunit